MSPSEVELIAAVRELARTKFAARAKDNDRSGVFSRENAEEMRALRLPSMPFSAEQGGMGVGLEAHVRVVEEIAYADGSSAVALNMHLFTAEALNGLPPFPRRNVVVEDLAKNDAMICGAVSIPSGEVDNRKSGMRFIEDGDDLVGNGKLGFASMSEGAKYIFASGTIARGEGAEPDIVLAFPDMSSPGLINLKNWDAMGFRSTASHDIEFDNLRIPKADAMVAPAAMIRLITQAQAADTSAANRRPRGVLGILAIWMGLSQAAYDFTLEYVGQRHGMVAGDSTVFGQIGYRSEQPWAQYGLGEMDHWLSTGRLALYDMCRRAYDEFPSANAFNHEMVRTIYTLRRMSEEISAASMRICGAHAYLRNRSLERIFRDLVGCNVMAWKTDQLRQTLGMAALGLPITVGGPAPT